MLVFRIKDGGSMYLRKLGPVQIYTTLQLNSNIESSQTSEPYNSETPVTSHRYTLSGQVL